jgi:hypothetical protein
MFEKPMRQRMIILVLKKEGGGEEFVLCEL